MAMIWFMTIVGWTMLKLDAPLALTLKVPVTFTL